MVFVNHCSLCFAKQLPSEVGLHQDDFSDEKSVLTVLSEKLQFLCFSQVPAGSDCSLSYLYCICRFSRLISTVLPAADMQVTRDKITTLTVLYCFCRFSRLISTVLPAADLQVTQDQIIPPLDLYCFCHFILLISTVLHFTAFGKFQQARLPLLQFHTASVA